MFQFPLTSPAMATVLLLTLATILTVTSNQQYNEAYYQSLGPGYSYAYLQPSLTDKFLPCRSLQECAAISLNSNSEFFSYNKVNQLCKNYSPNNIMTVKSVQDSNETSFYRRSEWIKTYALSVGANSLVYNSFINKGSPSTWNVDKCSGKFCPNFLRHPILDFWDHLPIDEVKLVLYKNQTAVLNMVFYGRNSTLESWFSKTNLKSSPWNDLSQANPQYFGINIKTHKRRFYIATDYDGCVGHYGWLIINENHNYCSWEKTYHPIFLYSTKTTKVTFSDGHGLADSMAIFIRLRP